MASSPLFHFLLTEDFHFSCVWADPFHDTGDPVLYVMLFGRMEGCIVLIFDRTFRNMAPNGLPTAATFVDLGKVLFTEILICYTHSV